jgi:hypothetical protein
MTSNLALGVHYEVVESSIATQHVLVTALRTAESFLSYSGACIRLASHCVGASLLSNGRILSSNKQALTQYCICFYYCACTITAYSLH